MSQQVRIERELIFSGIANHQANVTGDMQEKRIHLHDQFTGVSLDTNLWATDTTGTTSATIAISEVAGGECLHTTGTADNDSQSQSTSIIFSATKKAVCEAKVLITDVSGTALFVGFSDAKDEANNSIAIHYPGDVLTTVATNGVGFVIDADHATSSIMCAGVKADTDATAIDTGTDWADGETKTLRIELDGDDNARFLLDGVEKAFVVDAVTTGTLLCFTIQAMTRANDGANTVRVKRVDVWCDET